MGSTFHQRRLRYLLHDITGVISTFYFKFHSDVNSLPYYYENHKFLFCCLCQLISGRDEHVFIDSLQTVTHKIPTDIVFIIEFGIKMLTHCVIRINYRWL